MPIPLYLNGGSGANHVPQLTRFSSSVWTPGDPEHDAGAPSTEGLRGGASVGGPDSGTANCHAGGRPSSRPKPDLNAAIGFMKQVFPGRQWPGHTLLWTLDRVSGKKVSRWCATTDEAEKEIREIAQMWRSLDVYLGMGMSGPGLRKGSGAGDLSPSRRLLKEPAVDEKTGAAAPTPSVHYIPGTWADIDYGEDGHRTSNGKVYAPSMQAVLERLTEVAIQPTKVVHSGHGLQAFWLFDQLLDISSSREAAADRQRAWIDYLRDVFHPYALDSVIDLSRVMRLPGFVNHKVADRPVLVAVISTDGPRTTPDAVDEAVSARKKRGRSRVGRESSTNGSGEPFSFDPESELDQDKFRASYSTSPTFARAWDGDRPGPGDKTPSGHDMALANAAVSLGWTKREIIVLLIARRRKAKATEKPPSYYLLTVEKAFSWDEKTKSVKGPNAGKGRKGKDKEPSAKELERHAVEEYISEVVASKEVVHWLDDFFQLQSGRWRRQSERYFEKQLSSVVATARGADRDVVIPRGTLGSYVESLARSVTPPCIDTSLLAEENRTMNINLDTGEILSGSAFTNGVLFARDDGTFELVGREPRHFYPTSRPYSFPTERPARPEAFDAWLQGRLPVENTRRALWELLGATVAQEMHARQQLVALLGPGRSGKGTMLRVASMLVGTEYTASFAGGPIRLAKSQFGLAGLLNVAIVLFPDMPPPPRSPGRSMDHYLEGLGIMKSLTGGDPIAVERKFKEIITVVLNAAVWVDSNFDLSGFIQGQEDSFSWVERIVPIPFNEQIVEHEREQGYELRFKEELPRIAWYAVDAYAEAKKRGHITWSKDMLIALVQLSQGKHGELEAFFRLLHCERDTWLSRSEVRRAAEDFIEERLDNAQLASLYRYCKAISGVTENKRQGVLGFKNLRVKTPD